MIGSWGTGKVLFVSAAIALAIGLAWLTFFTGPSHRFVVNVDEPAKSVSLTLNDETTQMSGGPTRFTASRNVSDASGNISIQFNDGGVAICTIGYITNREREPHVANVQDRKCSIT